MKKYLRILTIGIFILFIFIWCIKSACLTWVEVEKDYAKVTINFLVPMVQQLTEEMIGVESELETAQSFDYTYEWLNDHVLCLKIKENNTITGQKIKLHISKVTSQYDFIKKTVHIPIQFKSSIKLISPIEEVLIASHQGFEIQFNTPISVNKIRQYLISQIPFIITPVETTNIEGKTYIDSTRFILRPREILENNKTYTLAFKKGMPSKSGSFLENTQYITLKTDVKPEITSTYPRDGDKWIGLYPKIIITTNKPVVSGMMQIGEHIYEGHLIDAQHIQFVLKGLLKPESNYHMTFEVTAASGEKSLKKTVKFTTTTIEKERMWVEIKIGQPSVLKVYKGTNVIRQMNCSIGKEQFEPSIGTYYLQGKGEVYEDTVHKEGANYWLPINDHCAFQGVIREDNWEVKNCASNEIGARTDRSNIILEESDAKWMYENLPIEAMIIIRK